MNQNQIKGYNYKDKRYIQSIISNLIDQFCMGSKEPEVKILSKINIDEIILLNDILCNISINEQYKILYGFDKMFQNLHKKRILKIKYSDIVNNITYNNTNNDYKVISIDFYNKEINDLEKIINKINEYFNHFGNISNVEILSFNNFKLNNISSDINNIKNIDIITSNTFSCLKNLKEFFINNERGYSITNMNIFKNIHRNKNKFVYFYLGYDNNNNLIFYRNGINKIKSMDILDLFNFYNTKIIKLYLLCENIQIILNEEKTYLQIINILKNDISKDNTRHPENFYYFSITYLSEFIYNLPFLNKLTIDGFDFSFNDIHNNNIKILSINYNTNTNEITFKSKIKINIQDKEIIINFLN